MEQNINEIINCKDSYNGMTLTERMVHFHTPAISIAVVKDYAIDTAFALGVKKWGTEEAVTPSHLFQAASISKPIFATAVMKLQEQGIIDIDKDVNNYLKNFKTVTATGETRQATLRQIFCHSAGFTVHGFDGYSRNMTIPSTLDILNGKGNSDMVIIEPENIGHYAYSGGGFTVAQKAICDFTGKDLPDIMDELIINPLGMTLSTYNQPLPQDRLNDCVLGYYENYEPVEGGFNVYPEMAAAGLWTTPSDLARFGIAVQKGLLSDEGFLCQKALQEMLTPQTIVDQPWGIAFGISQNYFMHNGCNNGYESIMKFTKENGYGAVIMVNSNEGSLCNEVFNAISKVFSFPKEI